MDEKNENSVKVKALIKEYSHLFWYTPEDKKTNISVDFLVEMILNFGDEKAVKKLFDIIGIDEVYKILKDTKDRKKGNYFPEIYNFFLLYTKRHASGNPL